MSFLKTTSLSRQEVVRWIIWLYKAIRRVRFLPRPGGRHSMSEIVTIKGASVTNEDFMGVIWIHHVTVSSGIIQNSNMTEPFWSAFDTF
jgi:hypothetical protein